MRNGFRLFLVGALGLVLSAAGARAQDKSKEVSFETSDGVTLRGTFWPQDLAAGAKAPKFDATVLILHNFSKDGGSSKADNVPDLATELSHAGYSVLTFDFRGYGISHDIGKEFWNPVKNRHNVQYVKGANKNPPPDTLEHSMFDNNSGDYYPYLVNDVVAAKSYLDRHNGEGGINSSNVIVIGAGEGATVGAMWMASQWHLQKVSGIDKLTGKRTLDEAEGRDECGALWLSINPKLGGHTIPSPVRNWLEDVAGSNKVPMAFLYGKDDATSADFAKEAIQSIGNRIRRDNPGLKDDDVKDKLSNVGITIAIEDTKLTGSKLLGVDKTINAIVQGVGELANNRGPREARKHDLRPEDSFLWTFPNMLPQDAKIGGLDSDIRTLPAQVFLRSSGN